MHTEEVARKQRGIADATNCTKQLPDTKRSPGVAAHANELRGIKDLLDAGEVKLVNDLQGANPRD